MVYSVLSLCQTSQETPSLQKSPPTCTKLLVTEVALAVLLILVGTLALARLSSVELGPLNFLANMTSPAAIVVIGVGLLWAILNISLFINRPLPQEKTLPSHKPPRVSTVNEKPTKTVIHRKIPHQPGAGIMPTDSSVSSHESESNLEGSRPRSHSTSSSENKRYNSDSENNPKVGVIKRRHSMSDFRSPEA